MATRTAPKNAPRKKVAKKAAPRKTVKKAAPKKAAPAGVAAKKAAPRNNQAQRPTSTEPALEKLFIDEIKDIYWAEKKLVKTLPKMQKAATSTALQNAIANHLEETKEHVSRLEQVFEHLGQRAQAKKCDAMEGLTQEGESIISDTEKGSSTRDVGVILASQKVEHYEIATYGTLVNIARVLGHTEVADLLAQTLEEEKNADTTLTSIAEDGINYQAGEEEEEDDEEEEEEETDDEEEEEEEEEEEDDDDEEDEKE